MRKNNSWMLYALGAVVLVVVGGGSYFLLSQSSGEQSIFSSSPKSTYCDVNNKVGNTFNLKGFHVPGEKGVFYVANPRNSLSLVDSSTFYILTKSGDLVWSNFNYPCDQVASWMFSGRNIDAARGQITSGITYTVRTNKYGRYYYLGQNAYAWCSNSVSNAVMIFSSDYDAMNEYRSSRSGAACSVN